MLYYYHAEHAAPATGAGTMQPLHEVRDMKLYSELVASMTANGWTGAPVVRYGNDLVTGSHRYAAAVATDTRIESITLEEVMEEAGMTPDEIAEWEAEWDYPSVVELAGTDLLDRLPESIKEKYGIDIH